MPLELFRWTMAERFGWSLEQVDALPMSEVMQFLEIEDGRVKASKSIVKR